MSRASTEELALYMRIAAHMVPAGTVARNIKTNGEYIVRGHSLSATDLTPLVQYSHLYGQVIVFSRPAQEFQKKFTRADGQEWKTLPFPEVGK